MPRLKKKSEFQLRSAAKERTRRLRMMRRLDPDYKRPPKTSESNEQVTEINMVKADSSEEHEYKAIRQAQIISDYSLRRNFPANSAVEQQEFIYQQKIMSALQNHDDTSSNESMSHSVNTNSDFQYRLANDNSSEYSEFFHTEEETQICDQRVRNAQFLLQEQHNQLSQDCEVRLSRCDDSNATSASSIATATTTTTTASSLENDRSTIENLSQLSEYEYLRLQCELRRSNLYAKYKKKIKHGYNNLCLCCGGTGFASQVVKEMNTSRLPLTKIPTPERKQL
ncbi:uncharacterized protein LOC119662215 isoform X2 [Teleopsis dalmanni]|nr:uncharacterized protein LOC119662215 isoform X2 [Teleopsis dalmanni]XP_037927719.1 uncharacterized protein LOC119662215 isoform X2 [Teleopsis dalmanni]